ncbi:DUF6085 family protein [Streptomyces sp. NPDC004237]|uniref:DUF6085 family protein n=1 Tax=Streptomyces sp. NPDC004237 TaxID=3154455 RepID=UPI0033AC2B3F
MTTPLPVVGYCPLGCGATLRLTKGVIACSDSECPRPDAVHTILSDDETEHILQFDEHGFTIRHPLRERLDDDLMRCDLHQFCATMLGPPRDGPGRYRATRLGPRDWVFQRMGGESA